MKAAAIKSGDIIRRFENYRFKCYILITICLDEIDRARLIDVVGGLQPWGGPRIKAIDVKDFLNPVKHLTLVRGTSEVPESALKRLMLENPTLKIGQLTIFEHRR